ncbi:hypothetical protein MLD38_033602 [Melastoma candidum]|uniref:Uncharacterized protein n=1 Tax=Melastoma candidum TaxID=119954 RepID=A0ACB9M7W6_9MYRT|nr:hypothetical protein MLD38_033602 [Melastoma candidum]
MASFDGVGHDDEQRREKDRVSSSPVPAVSSEFFLDHVGDVNLTLDSDGLSWKSLESMAIDKCNCLGAKRTPLLPTGIKISDVYAVELVEESVTSAPMTCPLEHLRKVFRFMVYGSQNSVSHPSHWTLCTFTFGHPDIHECQMWVNLINAAIHKDMERPKNLLVFVHPLSGKGNGRRTWETVSPIFSRANVLTKVIVTERAGHAFDVMAAISNEELQLYDGVVAVGGDGFFNEVLNGLLCQRHKAPYPPAPADFVESLGVCNDYLTANANGRIPKISSQDEDLSPLISTNGSHFSGFRSEDDPYKQDKSPEVRFSAGQLRLGLIPSGSTDAIVICTTGARDPVTSALQIVLGKRVPLDIAHIVRWKATSESKVEPFVRYAASFAGYGFYGDVISESEKYRWMGPKRYDYAGTKVFLRHRSYEAEVSYLGVLEEETNKRAEDHWVGCMRGLLESNKRQRVICRENCDTCSPKSAASSQLEPRMTWLKSKGRYLSIGAAIISCRNGRAPDGLVADAHLADGFMHLILIKDCPRALYLGHLLQLAKKDGDPLNFEFVEHHKTSAFTFRSSGKSSIWNVDGELFQAHQLSGQVIRGLVSLFACGPRV